jgi:hypothetical protein
VSVQASETLVETRAVLNEIIKNSIEVMNAFGIPRLDVEELSDVLDKTAELILAVGASL